MQMAQKHDILYVSYYTDGSAAKKIAPAFPVTQPGKKPTANRRKKAVLYIDPVAVCGLIVAAVLLVMMAVGLTHLQNAQAEAQRMENYLGELKSENVSIQEKFDREVDLETVEKTALAMGMVPKDQVTTVQIQVDEIHLEEPAEETVWEKMYAVLTNLF